MLPPETLARITDAYRVARARWSARPAEVRQRLKAVGEAADRLADALGDLQPIDRELAGIPTATACVALNEVYEVAALARDAAADLARRIGKGGRRRMHHLVGEVSPRFDAVVAVRDAYRRIGIEPTTAQNRDAAVEVFETAGDANPWQGVDDLIRRLPARKNQGEIEPVQICRDAVDAGIILCEHRSPRPCRR